MSIVKGDTVRVGMDSGVAYRFLRRGTRRHPRSRRWGTIERTDYGGTELYVPMETLYIDGPAWREWLRVYVETSAESLGERTCPCCGQIDWQKNTDAEALRRRSRRLHEAHNAALIEAGRPAFDYNGNEVRA